MKSQLKTVLPILLFVLLVFGVTFMKQFTTPPPQKTDADDQPEEARPLLAFTQQVNAGFFEVGTNSSQNRVGFLVFNVRPAPVFLTALPPSCSLCTSASAAVLPDDALARHAEAGSVAALFGPAPDLLSAVSWVRERSALKWHQFEFNNPKNLFEIPAAPPGGRTLAVIELGFDMQKAGAPYPRSAYFDLYDAAGQKLVPQPMPFSVLSGGRERVELPVQDLSVGTLTEANPTQTVDVVCVSAFHQTADLQPPTIAAGNNDPHVTVGKPVPLSAEALEAASRKASVPGTQEKPPLIVVFRGGYACPVTVTRTVNGKMMDVGAFDKDLYVSAGTDKPSHVHVRGGVAGVVQLEGGSKVDFGSYDSNFAQKKDVRLWSDKPGLELETIAGQTEPNFLKVTLGVPTAEAGRTYWPMTVQIPAREGRRPPWDGVILVRTKGDNPVNVRIPVGGHGR